MIKKLFLTFFLVLSSFIVLSQSVGDYRSNTSSGSWTSLSSWQYYNGSSWINATNYPGQVSGSYSVLIQSGDIISIDNSGITTQQMGVFTISGSLVLTGVNTGSTGTDFSFNTQSIIVTPFSGTITFNNKTNLILPSNSSLQVVSSITPFYKGLTGDCSHNQEIIISSNVYAYCNGGGSTTLTFDQVMSGGGTLSAVATSNSPVCQGSQINLFGSYTGVQGTTVTYGWSIQDPNNIVTTTSTQNPIVANAIAGTYIATLSCTTTYNGNSYSNSRTISISVTSVPSVSVIGGGEAEVCVNLTTPAFTNATAGGVWSITNGTGTASITTGGIVTGLSAGTVTVVYTVTSGGCSNTITEALVVNALPVISTQPLSQLDCEVSIVSFNVVAGGAGPFTYIWQRKKPSDLGFVTIPVETNVTYPTAGEIRIENVGSALSPNGTQYQVVISNGTCSITSNIATLSVNEITNITSPSLTPSQSVMDVTLCYGANYSYTAAISNPSNGPVSYQWKSSIVPGLWNNVVDGTHFSGAKTATLNIINGTPVESARYRVDVIFNRTGGDCSVSSFSRIRLLTFLPLLLTPETEVIQPSCTTATGTITVAVQSVTDTYSFDNGETYQSGNIKSGLAAGSYDIIIKNIGGCLSSVKNCVLTGSVESAWNGISWLPSIPTSSDKIVFNGSYSSIGDLTACSCQVNSGNVVINSGDSLILANDLVVLGGTLTFENAASLVQINNVTNTGNITYKRLTNLISNLDYTYWSSPVSPQTLYDVSPNTLGDKFYSFDAIADDWKQESTSSTMSKGFGYIIRGPENFVAPSPPGLFQASFNGVPNNGTINIPIPTIIESSYLLGNPYSSALDADVFLTTNNAVLDGTIYFWTHNTPIGLAVSNPGSGAYAYSSDDYASYNLTGGVETAEAISDLTPGDPNDNKPSGKIAAGQGFFVTSIAAGNVTFNNNMRVGVGTITGNNSQFFKNVSNSKITNEIEKHRLWLNLTNSQGAFKQTLIGYVTGATNDYDNAFDGESFDGNDFVDFYSVNQEKNLVIQGRALPFDKADEVFLGYSSTIEGSFTIDIDQVDGVLADQEVFLEDKNLDIIHDLKKGAYNFSTQEGVFNDRFVLLYSNKKLRVDTIDKTLKEVCISNKNREVKINATNEIIDKVLIFDFLGRQIYGKNDVNNKELLISNFSIKHQALLFKVILQNGQITTDKIIY
jgi:hypothetical protein